MKSLKEFIDDIEKKEGSAALAANETIALFKQRVSQFYEHIEQDWLKELIETGKIVCAKREISVTEESLGTYPIDEMTLTFGRFVIRLTPIGTILIGSPGRIDMTYEGKSRMFVLIDKRITNASQQIVIKEYIGTEPVDKEKKAKAKPMSKPEYVWKFVDDLRLYTYSIVDRQSFQDLIVKLING